MTWAERERWDKGGTEMGGWRKRGRKEGGKYGSGKMVETRRLICGKLIWVFHNLCFHSNVSFVKKINKQI